MVEIFLQYVAFEKRHSPHTITSYRNDLEQFVAHIKENFQLENLLEADHNNIRSWIVSLSEAKILPISINRKIATLKSFYKFLLIKGHLQNIPTGRIKPLKVAKKTPQFIEESNLLQLFDNFVFTDDFEGTRDRLVMELLYGTGMREIELLGLKDKNIDFVSTQITVLGKGNKQRIIPITRSLSLLIADYQEKKIATNFQNITLHNSLIVTDKGEPAYPMLIYRIVRKYLDMITTNDKRSPHVLRHTFATHLLNKGADLNAIKEILGHSSLSATQIYTHNSLEKLKETFQQAHPKA